ncbi:12090_t:CDS:1, partial [Dentiscutata erythropus]
TRIIKENVEDNFRSMYFETEEEGSLLECLKYYHENNVLVTREKRQF